VSVKKIPEGYHTVTPYLVMKDATRALEYYKQAFGAQELFRMPGPGGKVMHAEIRIGTSPVMLADEMPEMGYCGPKAEGGSPVSLMVYVEDVDTVFERAIAAGGTVKRPVENQFYGDRTGTLQDPFGHVWSIATHVEDVPTEDLNRRFEEMMKQHHGG